jgi:hypothetical protein
MTLNLVEHGTTVTGTGTSWAFIYPPTRQFSVAGSYSRPDLRLTFADDSGVIRGFTARVEDLRHMLGVENLAESEYGLRHPLVCKTVTLAIDRAGRLTSA